MIEIKPSPTADSRTCNVNEVTENQLYDSSMQHISDVRKGLEFFREWLYSISTLHDFDKLTDIKKFYHDFKNNFETHSWWDNHRKVNRHHLNHIDGIPENVNLLDVLEYITDCVMAGMARNADKYYDPDINEEVLMRAFDNTIKLLRENVKVVEEDID